VLRQSTKYFTSAASEPAATVTAATLAAAAIATS